MTSAHCAFEADSEAASEGSVFGETAGPAFQLCRWCLGMETVTSPFQGAQCSGDARGGLPSKGLHSLPPCRSGRFKHADLKSLKCFPATPASAHGPPRRARRRGRRSPNQRTRGRHRGPRGDGELGQRWRVWRPRLGGATRTGLGRATRAAQSRRGGVDMAHR